MDKFEVEKYPQEIAEALYEQAKDMDYMDYEDEKEEVIKNTTPELRPEAEIININKEMEIENNAQE